VAARSTARRRPYGAAAAGTKLLHEHKTLALVDGRARIAVVADTHSEPHPRARELVARERPDVILHAGDIGALRVLDDFATVAPVWAVRGNIDGRAAKIPDVLRVDLTEGEAHRFTLVLLHIGVSGPKLRADAARLAEAAGATLVVCGHSHVPFIGRDRGLAVFNPGSVGPRRFYLPIVFGIIDVAPDGVRMKHVDCETGEVWLP
jgi:uncharacterized protein